MAILLNLVKKMNSMTSSLLFTLLSLSQEVGCHKSRPLLPRRFASKRRCLGETRATPGLVEGGEVGVSGASLPEGSGGVKRGLQAGQAEHACRKRAGSGTQVVQARLHRLVAADDAWLQIHYISCPVL